MRDFMLPLCGEPAATYALSRYILPVLRRSRPGRTVDKKMSRTDTYKAWVRRKYWVMPLIRNTCCR